MKYARTALRLVVLAFLVFLLCSIFKNPHPELYLDSSAYPFSRGNADDEIRMEILDALREFQAGYAARDLTSVESFMNRLFSRENVLILGTMPQEIYTGFREASSLVHADWSSWGDCTFLVDRANISAHENVAWFSTVGYVRFDIIRLLVAPVRLSGVYVHEGDFWKLQQVQYQFDLDLSFTLICILLLAAWIAIELLALALSLYRRLSQSHSSPQA